MMKLSAIILRPENKEDQQAIFEVNKLAFKSEEEAILVNRLRTGTAFIPALSLVAVLEDKIVGHILFTTIRIKPDTQEDAIALALAPLAVLPDYQSKSIGGALIREHSNRCLV